MRNVFEIPIEEMNKAECMKAKKQLEEWAAEYGWDASEYEDGTPTAGEEYTKINARLELISLDEATESV